MKTKKHTMRHWYDLNYAELTDKEAFEAFAETRCIMEASFPYMLQRLTPEYLDMFKAGIENWRDWSIRFWSNPVYGNKSKIAEANEKADEFIAKAVKKCAELAK